MVAVEEERLTSLLIWGKAGQSWGGVGETFGSRADASKARRHWLSSPRKRQGRPALATLDSPESTLRLLGKSFGGACDGLVVTCRRMTPSDPDGVVRRIFPPVPPSPNPRLGNAVLQTSLSLNSKISSPFRRDEIPILDLGRHTIRQTGDDDADPRFQTGRESYIWHSFIRTDKPCKY
jgi:hypothetical protein